VQNWPSLSRYGSLLSGLIVAAAMSVAAAQSSSNPGGTIPPAAPDFGDFGARVQKYVAYRQPIRDALPHLRSTKNRTEILARKQQLAQKLREGRANAAQGDIFTAENSAQFRRAIAAVFNGANARSVRKTVRQGEPVGDWKPTVNGEFPARMPSTTVPPTLLLRLPALPSQLAYRLVGHDFVLYDIEANMVIDFIPGALP